MTASSQPSNLRDSSVRTRINFVLIGIGAGLLNGLLGIGGGIIIVPGLIFLVGYTPQAAVSTSLGSILTLSLLALISHWTLSGFLFESWQIALLVVSGMLGAQLGHVVLRYMSTKRLIVSFSILSIAFSINLLLQVLGWMPRGIAGTIPPWWSFILVGGISGFFSGSIGVGGGGMVLLIYAIGFQVPILNGLSIALLMNMVNAGSSVAASLYEKRINWNIVSLLTVISLVGIVFGTWLAFYLPADILRSVFSLFFMSSSVLLLRKTFFGKTAFLKSKD